MQIVTVLIWEYRERSKFNLVMNDKSMKINLLSLGQGNLALIKCRSHKNGFPWKKLLPFRVVSNINQMVLFSCLIVNKLNYDGTLLFSRWKRWKILPNCNYLFINVLLPCLYLITYI